jgi:hypothetical protein
MYKLWLMRAKISPDKRKLRGSSLIRLTARAHRKIFNCVLIKMSEQLSNPADPEQLLKRSIGLVEDPANPPQPIFPEDSAVTKAEKVERNGVILTEGNLDGQEPAAKRFKMDDLIKGVVKNGAEEKKVDSRDKVKGIALVKTELVLRVPHEGYY